MKKEYKAPCAIALLVSETLLLDTSSISSAGSNTSPDAPKIAETKFDSFDGLDNDFANDYVESMVQSILN